MNAPTRPDLVVHFVIQRINCQGSVPITEYLHRDEALLIEHEWIWKTESLAAHVFPTASGDEQAALWVFARGQGGFPVTLGMTMGARNVTQPLPAPKCAPEPARPRAHDARHPTPEQVFDDLDRRHLA